MKKQLQKKLLAVLLTLAMLLSLLPGTALAAVEDLMGNSGEKNQALLDELARMTGGDSDQVRAMLEGLGLLDENGELNLSQSVRLDGEELTLDEVMALLEDPAADLSRMADVDGTPLSLGDLKTILRIERELARIQETYFSGRTFTGESLDNLNSLMTQLETEGISLHSAGGEDTVRMTASSASASLSASNFLNNPSYTQDVFFDLSFTDAEGAPISLPAEAGFGLRLLSGTFPEGFAAVTLNDMTTDSAIEITPDADGRVTLPAGTGKVRLEIKFSHPNSSQPLDFARTDGTTQCCAELFDPEGMLFRDGRSLQLKVDMQDTVTRRITYNLGSKKTSAAEGGWSMAYTALGTDPTADFLATAREVCGDADPVIQVVAALGMFDPGLSTEFFKDDPLTEDGECLAALPEPCDSSGTPMAYANYAFGYNHVSDPDKMYPLENGSDASSRFITGPAPSDKKLSVLPINIGSQTYNSVSFRVIATEMPAMLKYNPEHKLLIQYKSAAARLSGQLQYNRSGASISLVFPDVVIEDVSIPAGTYATGQTVPVTVTFSQPVSGDGLTLTANSGNPLPAVDAGVKSRRHVFYYTVQPVDNTEMSVQRISGIKMLNDESAPENNNSGAGWADFPGVTLESALMRDAVESVSAAYAGGEAVITLNVNRAQQYRQKYSDTVTGGYASFRAVVTGPTGTSQTVDFTLTEPSQGTIVPVAKVTGLAPAAHEQAYAVAIWVYESGTDTVGRLIRGKTGSFTIPAKVDVERVTITADPAGLTELSMAETVRPTLTAAVAPETANCKTGAWISSDPAIAAVDGSGMVALGSKVGEVTLTYTADNGTEDTADDKSDSITYTVTAGDSPALVIPAAASTIAARLHSPVTVLWSSNSTAFTEENFIYTVEVFEGNFVDNAALEAALAGEAPPAVVWSGTADKSQNSIAIPENILTELSGGTTPAYTVRVSMPHPKASNDTLTALCWIVVDPQPAGARLTPPERLSITDGETAEIGWAIDNYEAGITQAALTITRVTGDSESEAFDTQTITGETGSYTLDPESVGSSNLKETYMVALSVQNSGDTAPDVDAFPLYVYREGALKLQTAGGVDLDGALTLDNTPKVLPYAGGGGSPNLQALREELALIEYVGINSGDYSWSQLTDRIQWETDSSDVVSVNYRQGTLYEDIKNFTMSTYLPETKMALSSVADGTATITATHANTGMSDSVEVNVHTLRDQFFLFRLTPMLKTTLTYTDGANTPRTVTTNDDGTLALYEPNGIGSDISLKAADTEGHVYLGTIYKENLLSGERDATKLQLYPLNTFKLRQAAQAELTITSPDGAPYTGDVTLRGGVYKNGGYCQDALLALTPSDTDLKDGKQGQTAHVQNGKLTLCLDSTQFWSAGKGENSADAENLSARDRLQYIFEITNIGADAYYPMLVYANGSLTLEDVMRSAGGVLALEEVPTGQKEKPFLSNQTMDYGLSGGRLVDVRGSTGHVGPSSIYPTATLRSTMLLWGDADIGAADYALAITDEYGYVPAAQTSKIGTYPFSSIPVVYNDLTLSEATVTTSGWVTAGRDMGLRLRLHQQSALLREQALPFRLMDMTRVEKVTESDNVSNMLVTLTAGSALGKGESSGGSGNLITNTILGLMGDLSGPVNGTDFKMILSPSGDNTKFRAFIWAGYDSMGLDEIDYSANGLALDYGLMEGELSMAPGIGDLTEMAKGRQGAQGVPTKGWGKSSNFGGQLEGYYEAEVAYNFAEKKWEIYTLCGGFTAGFSGGMTFGINAFVGPIPLFAEFGFGGAVQLDFKAATRYSEQGGLAWAGSVTSDTVNDYLSTLRLSAYVNAFGGIGVDYSIVALKIGMFGEVKADSSNLFLSRTYLADPGQRQLNGQQLGLSGEVGIKLEASVLFFSFKFVLASGKLSDTWNFNDMEYIDNYWKNTGSGKSMLAATAVYAAQNGLSVAGSTAELQDRDYLEQYDRMWYGGAMRPMLMAMDDPNAVELLQDNANPASLPVMTDDGALLLYVNDGSSDSIYDSRVYATSLSGGSYAEGKKIADPANFDGYGDSGVALAGGGSFAAAAWVRLASQIEGKDSGSAVTLAEQNLLMNGAEIVVSVYDGSEWESTRLTDNATPDLAPAVAVGGGKAIAAWRSVYAADPGTEGNDGENNLLNFTAKDTILYSVYDGSGWSVAQELYNGSAGAVKALQAAMLPDGTAAVVYTLDRDGADGSSADYEIAYTMVGNDGTLGSTMIATSDDNMDENPQIVAASFGNADDRFVIGWHSVRDGVSDIHLLAVNGEGAMSNSFPSAISQVVEQNAVAIGGEFRFAGMDSSYKELDHLVILWPETVADAATGAPDHSVLKAVKFRTTGNGVGLSAPLEVAELPARTMLDYFDAYVSGDNQIKAVLQGTWYDPDSSETIEGVSVAREKSMLYTATGDFINRATVTSILPDYANLALNSQTAIQFTLFNAGFEDITAAKVTLDGTNYSFDGLTLAPNESTILTVWHPVGSEVKNLPYTVTADFGTASQVTADSGTVHLDYPDVGISQMELASESEGMRTLRMTLYNQSAATLAGDKNRSVTLSFCTDGLYNALVDVTAATTAGVSIDPATKILTVSGEDNLALIDQGAFTLELAFNVGAHVAAMTDASGQPLTEIPDGGVRLFAKASILEGAETLPEYSSGNNESSIRFDSLLKRTNEAVTLGVEQGTSGGASTATITLRNNSLQPQATGGAVIAMLLDAKGNVLEQKQTGINAAELIGEGSKKSDVAFTKSGSRVTATYGVLSDDSNSTNLSDLRFEGLPVSLSDFTMDADGNYAASVTTQAASTLVSFVAAGTAASVTVNGAASTGSTNVNLSSGTSAITVKVTALGADRTYVLTVQRTGGGNTGDDGGDGTATYTLRFETNGGSAISNLSKSDGTVVDLSSYTPTRTDYTFAGWYSDAALTIRITSVKLTKNTTVYAGWTTAEMPFADVAAETYYYDAVQWAVKKGVTSGTSATTFAPNATCTRAETVTFLWRAMGSPEPTTAVNPFTDVAADAYYYKAVLWAVEKNVTKGTSDTTFSPNMDCSRAQVVTFLHRAAGSPAAAAGLPFTDVAADAYYAQAVAWAAGENVTGGTGDNRFSPDSPCTRAQIVTLLYRQLGK